MPENVRRNRPTNWTEVSREVRGWTWFLVAGAAVAGLIGFNKLQKQQQAERLKEGFANDDSSEGNTANEGDGDNK